VHVIVTFKSDYMVMSFAGSTGVPKGCMLNHTGPLNTCRDCNKRYEMCPNSVVIGLADLTFGAFSARPMLQVLTGWVACRFVGVGCLWDTGCWGAAGASRAWIPDGTSSTGPVCAALWSDTLELCTPTSTDAV
jgi:hypothetical protein